MVVGCHMTSIAFHMYNVQHPLLFLTILNCLLFHFVIFTLEIAVKNKILKGVQTVRIFSVKHFCICFASNIVNFLKPKLRFFRRSLLRPSHPACQKQGPVWWKIKSLKVQPIRKFCIKYLCLLLYQYYFKLLGPNHYEKRTFSDYH